MEGYTPIRYIDKERGPGNQGVLLAEGDADKKKYLIKKVDLALLSVEDRKKSIQECRLLVALRHPNIVKYIESKTTPTCQYIVMEYMDGGTLEQHLASRRKDGAGPFSEDQILRWTGQLASAVQYCHNNNVLHRDITSANCYLSTNKQDLLLGDFGVAKVLSHTMAVARTIIGSPCNMSPEVISGIAYNQVSDIWSIGCLLFEMASLRRPFNSLNLNQLVKQVTIDAPPSPPSFCSPFLQRLISSLLQKDTSKRLSLSELLAAPEVQRATSGKMLSDPLSKATWTSTPAAEEEMGTWLQKHYAALASIQSYLELTRKDDENYVRGQMQRAKPRTPEINQDRLRRVQSSPVGVMRKKVSDRHLQQPVPQPLNHKQAQKQREDELNQKRARLVEEREARRHAQELQEKEKEKDRRNNAEERRKAGDVRKANQPSQAAKEAAELAEKKKRILKEREEKKNREEAALQRAALERKQNADNRKKASEFRRAEKQLPEKEVKGLASTYKGPATSSAMKNDTPLSGSLRLGYSSKDTPPLLNLKEKRVASGGGGGSRVRAKSEPFSKPKPIDPVSEVNQADLEDRRAARKQAQDEFRQKLAQDRQRALDLKKCAEQKDNIEICLPKNLR
eukprot:TRINITY_DN3903_c0_g1_i1.p1 TRINITY_DN3903_c0_g1~~TRINITY_DN3903_c0_g1_i1.p1  ORF type:complete len:622 (+),score=119.07 TRINITY_DN3903_c0_g1_i1:43-1908(+)